MPTILWTDENDILKATVYSDASADILDKRTNLTWHMGPVALQEDNQLDDLKVWQRTERSMCEQFPGRFQGKREDSAIRFIVLGRMQKPVGSFRAHYRLANDKLEVSISQIDDSIPSLVFPPPIESASLVLPRAEGKWIRKPLNKIFFYRFVRALNMRWFGGLDQSEKHGWMAIVREGWQDGGMMVTSLHASPAWTRSLNRWPADAHRTVSYGFTTGGYVGMAKTFRQWLKDNNLFRSLTDKIAHAPQLEHLAKGRSFSFFLARSFYRSRYENRFLPIPAEYQNQPEGLFVGHTYADVSRIFNEAKSLGMTQGMLHLHGIFRGGYDEMHPDIWPPEPKLGSMDELRALCSQSGNYFTSIHDNYQDIYEQSPSFPRGTCRLPDGSPLPGGLWAGGQAYILNSRNGLEYFRQNWPLLQSLNMGALYIDTLACEQLRQSFEPGNTLTRTQDEAYRKEIFALARQRSGMVFASEDGCDFANPYIDWVPNGPHQHEPAVSIPLWSLIYHDSLVTVRGVGTSRLANPLDDPNFRRQCSQLMLWGYPVVSDLSRADQWPNYKPSFTASLCVDRWLERVGTAAMTNHRYLTDDHLVEQTEWSNGSALIANFSQESRTIEGLNIPPGGHAIRS